MLSGIGPLVRLARVAKNMKLFALQLIQVLLAVAPTASFPFIAGIQGGAPLGIVLSAIVSLVVRSDGPAS